MRVVAAGALAAIAGVALAGDSPLEGLVAAEKSFAAESEAHGMRDAFLAFLAEDAITFRPGPILGHKSWEERTSPPGTLVWEPSFAEIAAAGDLGYTTGPWEYRPPAEKNQPTSYGHFVSVWKRSNSGDWLVALDIGIGHDKSEPGYGSGAFTAGPLHPEPEPHDRGGVSFGLGLGGRGFGVGAHTGNGAPDRFSEYADVLDARSLAAADREYGWRIANRGAMDACARMVAKDARFYREGGPPTVGTAAAQEILEGRGGVVTWLPAAQHSSASGDLGYTYGLLEWRAAAKSAPDTSAFVHIWRRMPGQKWQLVLDIENGFPKRGAK
jgi:ketosteroid isomerase-like protein